MKKQNGEITIKDILDIFIPKLWFILLVGIVVATVIGVTSSMKTNTYTATSTFMMVKVPMSNSEATNTGLNSGEIEAMQQMISSSKYVLSSTSFCQKVRDGLDGYEDVTASNINSMISVSLMDDTTCFAITIRSTDPNLSYAVANVVHDIFPADIMERLPYAIKISTLDYPTLPQGADDKNVVRNALIGAVVGIALAALVVFIINKFDVVIRSREKIEENFDIPILGVIPRLDPDD